VDKDSAERIAQKVNNAFKEVYPDGRDPKRIRKILKEIGDIWETYPDLRLGQMLLNVKEGKLLYVIEDEDLLSKLKELYIDSIEYE